MRGMVWPTVRYGTVRYGTVRYGTVRYGTVRYGTVRYGTVRYGTVRYGMVWYGMVRYVCINWLTGRAEVDSLRREVPGACARAASHIVRLEIHVGRFEKLGVL